MSETRAVYRLNRQLLRDTAVNLDSEAERMTERLQLGMTTERDRRALVERRSKLWRASRLLREIESP